MTWLGVPWMVGEGAQHSEMLGRSYAYQALRGNEGIVGVDDLQVLALASPGAAVRHLSGICSILNRHPGYDQEMYVGKHPGPEEVVPIAPTGAGVTRTDLIVARVEDPHLVSSSWPAPASIPNGPYIFTRVISGVPSTTVSVAQLALGYSAIALARVTLPPSTSAITQAMITDLRKIANPRRDRRVFTHNPAAAVQLTSTTFVDWPVGTGHPALVDVPSWATRAVVTGLVSGARIDRSSTTVNGTANGQIRVRLGGTSVAPTAVSQGAAYDVFAPFADALARHSLAVGDTIAVPVGLRGVSAVPFALQGLRTAAGSNKNLYVDTTSSVILDIEFQESAA